MARRPIPKTLVIFDCDGVLIDSEMLACTVQSRLFTGMGYPISPGEVMDRFVGLSARDMCAAIETALGRPLPDTYPARSAEALELAFRTDLAAVAGMPDLVARLARSRHPICVASSSSPERLALTLGLVGLRDLFAPHIFSATMVVAGKPAPDLFLHAATRMAADTSRSVVVEDSAAGIQAARAAGMTAIGFTGGSHCGSGHADRLRAAGAHLVVNTAAELSAALDARV